VDDSQASLSKFGAIAAPTASLADQALDLVGVSRAMPLAWRLLLALVAVVAALAIRFMFLGALGASFAYVTLYPAVAVAALLGGIGAGLLATFLAALLAHLVIAPLASGADLLGLAAFLISSSAIFLIAEVVHVSQVRLAGSHQTRQDEQRMRYFVERVPAAIAMFDTNMRYLAASARWRSDFSLANDLIGRSHYDVFPEISEHWKEVHRRALTGEGQRADTDIFVRADGSRQWLRWEVQPWHSGEHTIGGVTIFCEDLTEQKRIEEQLVQAQKMEIVGNLSGGIAHDFNNLLTAILGNAELLGEQLQSRQDLSYIANDIGRAAERGAELTQRLLAFGRRQILRPVEIDCNHLLGDLHKLLSRTLRADIEIRTDFNPNLPLAFADPVQLETAVLNLALNAQDAMPSGGRITITTSAAPLDSHYQSLYPDVLPGEYILIAVTDDGEGIPKDVLGRVFEPFFTTKDVGKGSGLGLSMVYGFVKQSNGHVSIYSEPGLGTTVRIYLPRASSRSAPMPDSTRFDEAMLPRGTETVLVVEDDPFVRSYVAMSLTSLGYSVLAAVDGNQALQKLRSDARIDLLFTDIVMPGHINGWELADLAHEVRPQLPVVLTSGYALETLVERNSRHAGLMILTKPYRKSDLAHRIREALARPAATSTSPTQ
jgi:PAS domain S-box-containing protein